jgi:endonuclease YncB( thermonuclease family)
MMRLKGPRAGPKIRTLAEYRRRRLMRMFALGLPCFAAVFLVGMTATVWRPNGEWIPRKAPPQLPDGQFNCVVSRVTDGDTFRCSDGTRVRLSSIDTPEMPGSCRPGRNCAPGDPFAAKAELQRLIAGKTVQCEPVGTSYNRIAAWCSVDGIDLSCAMYRGGYAIRLAQHDPIGRLCRD